MGLDLPRAGIEHRFRLTPRMVESPGWRDRVQLHIMAISECLAGCLEVHRRGLRLLGDLEEESLAEFLNHAMEWRALVDRVENARRVAASFLKIDPTKCQWIELAQDKRGRLAVKLCDAPIEVAPILRESLHDKMRSEVLTSATLTVAGQFEYLFQRIGLGARSPRAEATGDGDPPPARSIESLLLPAPFDYRKQVFLGVPTDLGDPRAPGFDDRLGDLAVRAISASGGRAFVLFTSWGQMKRVHAACAPIIRKQGIECLVQGEDTRDRLLRKFRADETSVLFATSSFWEGVDVRGRALELLIIAKLPFAVPNDPITEAQVEALQRQGKDAFNELVVPRAIIRLKQGFGRLIRAHSDRGAVIIGDERVVRMGYGRRFLQSLPDVEVRSLDTPALVAQLEAFYAGG
jgi:ATP-dependent DNA helicase DinG